MPDLTIEFNSWCLKVIQVKIRMAEAGPDQIIQPSKRLCRDKGIIKERRRSNYSTRRGSSLVLEEWVISKETLRITRGSIHPIYLKVVMSKRKPNCRSHQRRRIGGLLILARIRILKTGPSISKY